MFKSWGWIPAPRNLTGNTNPPVNQVTVSEMDSYVNNRIKDYYNDRKDNSLKIISGRTMVTKILDFCKRNGIRYDCPSLYYTMVQHGYFFYNIAAQVRARCFRELRVYSSRNKKKDSRIIKR